MAYKMKGAPKIDTSKKHGTNANYKKSGMTKDGAPFMGGLMSRIRKRPLDPLGIFGKGGKVEVIVLLKTLRYQIKRHHHLLQQDQHQQLNRLLHQQKELL